MEETLRAIENAVDEALAHVEKPLDDARGKPFAIFDFDNTCIINDIAEATLAYLCGHELLRDRTLLGAEDTSPGYHARVFQTYYALLKEGKTKAAYALNARMISGFSPAEIEAAALTAISEEGSRVGSKMLYGIHIERGLAPRKSVLTLMKYVQEKEIDIWIVSASPEVCVRAAMQHFGIDGQLIGVRARLEKGVFTAELLEPRPVMDGKVTCMRKFIDAVRDPLLVADDSPTGLPLLETAEIKVVVDRGNELAKIAHEHDWFLL